MNDTIDHTHKQHSTWPSPELIAAWDAEGISPIYIRTLDVEIQTDAEGDFYIHPEDGQRVNFSPAWRDAPQSPSWNQDDFVELARRQKRSKERLALVPE